MHGHWQNLNEDSRGRPKGSGFWHGRAWAYLGSLTINPEWQFGGRVRRLGVSTIVGGYEGNHLTFHLAVPMLFSLYLTFEHRIFSRPTRELSLSVDCQEWYIFWHLWADPDAGRFSWRYNCKSIEDLIKGRDKYSTETLEEQEVLIPMPEKSYRAHVTIFESTWRYPRWPWPKRMVRAEVEISDGIPIPGKGENSWDMGEDAIFGMTCPATTVEQAISRVVESAMRDRRRYGGSVMWQPEAKADA